MRNMIDIPLAADLRPCTFKDFFGQEHLVGNSGFITKSISAKTPLSIILWGPPGCGKTTLAHIYARAFSAHFVSFSTVFGSVSDLRKIVKEAEASPLFNTKTILFVDEIHRFNKAQQDAFLPYVERGTITLIGATTENPSFSLNNALLSRVRVLTLNPLTDDDLYKILDNYEKKHSKLPLDDDTRRYLITMAQGDGRYLLNMIENIRNIDNIEDMKLSDLELLFQKRAALYDRSGDGHYNLISALQKSIRGSDPDASLYWFARMLEGGEDPIYISRRLIRIASEDIGLADPEALKIALSARDAYTIMGSPEGDLPLAEAVVYLALAPKSNAIYTAYADARRLAADSTHMPPPSTILNAPTKLMKNLGYGKGYIYDHDTADNFSGQNYFPNGMPRANLYNPIERGFEREMRKRIDYFSGLRKSIASSQE